MASIFNLKSLILFFSQLLLLVSAQDVKCPSSFNCGFLGQIKFPFTTTQRPHCGVLAICGCDINNSYVSKTVQLRNSTWFQVLEVQPGMITIRDDDQRGYLRNKSCRAFSNKFTQVPRTSPLASFYIKYNITMFRCNHSLSVPLPNNFYNYSNANCPRYNIYYGPSYTELLPGFKWPSSLAPCSMIQLAVDANTTNNPFEFLSDTIVIKVQLSDDCEKCLRHGRSHCQLNNRGKFYCARAGSRSWVVKMVLGFGLAITVALSLVIFKIYYRRWKKKNPTNLQIEVFLGRHGPLQTERRYTYSEIKKVTNSFKNKLGQGGFGSVFKGQLHDGRYVAVKVLNEMKDECEDFINEIASISKTSHVNIVSLLGFCLEGSKRALIYEFMSNGSLEKFIFEDNGKMTDCQLDFRMLYHIVIGVARGLEYLHRGCNTRILHFDIRPHNILLDEDSNPKISDFRLAKICTRKESAVSIVGARGTAGYIAPEVFSRNFGVVSHKSDVYSYGMMVLEMVGIRKNIKDDVDRSSEIYFPHWIYNRLESNQELGMWNIRNECDDEKVRKMTIVGLWCIQTDPSTRPAMSKVVEMLEGRVELLQMPPKPYLYSPLQPLRSICHVEHCSL